MSWSITAASVPKEEIEERFDNALKETLAAQQLDAYDDDVSAQQTAAKNLIQDAADSGEVGDGPYNITAGGHRSRGDEMHSLSINIAGH